MKKILYFNRELKNNSISLDSTEDNLEIKQLTIEVDNSDLDYYLDIINKSYGQYGKVTVIEDLEGDKQTKISEMSAECRRQIVYGFYSDCLGAKDESGNIVKEHFDCADTDQVYIQGLANKAALISSGVTADTTLEWKKSSELICYPWTAQQCIKLGLDMFSHIAEKKKRYEAIRQYIQYDESLTDSAIVLAIKWDDIIPDKYFSVITQGSNSNATA